MLHASQTYKRIFTSDYFTLKYEQSIYCFHEQRVLKMYSMFELSFLMLSFLTFIHSYTPEATPVYENNVSDLFNEYLTVKFNLSNGQILSLNYKTQLVTIVNETSVIYLNNLPVDSSKLVDYKEDTNSISFTFFLFSCI